MMIFFETIKQRMFETFIIQTYSKYLTLWISLGILSLAFCPALFSMELGYTGKYSETRRKHSDSDNFDSKFSFIEQELLLQHELNSEFHLQYSEKHQDWNLSHSDGTRYIDLDFRFHTPEFRYDADNLYLKLSVSLLDITRNQELYNKIAEDEKDNFILPLVNAKYSFSNANLEVAGWREIDVQAFNYHRYTLFLYEVMMAGGELSVADNQKIKLTTHRYFRTYPKEYDLTKNEYSAKYIWTNVIPAKENFEWRELSAEYKEIHYPESILTEFHFFNALKFVVFDINNFLSYDIWSANYHTTYREGIWKYSLIEEDKLEWDILQSIEYAGFKTFYSGSLVFNWKVMLENSLSQKSYLQYEAQLGLSYIFK